MIKVLILLAVLALFAVSQAVAKPQYYVADGLYYGYPYAAYYGAYYPHYYYGR
uniref:Putative secreted tyrosine rich salivary protein n=1 Tax=Rhipicephalus sanguineus TaxID=34632 RepID=C9W1N6_RHISA